MVEESLGLILAKNENAQVSMSYEEKFQVGSHEKESNFYILDNINELWEFVVSKAPVFLGCYLNRLECNNQQEHNI